MSVGKKSENNFLLEFIECYHSLTALWDVKCKEYSDRSKKEIQYEMLLEKYKEYYPKACMKEMQKKINILRSNYKREKRRLSEADKSGAGVNDVYSKLWYFEAMNFLDDVETPCPSRNSIKLNDNEESEQQEKKKKKLSTSEELLQLVSQKLNDPQYEFKKEGEILGAKLAKMDTKQAVIASKLMHEVVFHGSLGNLNLNASISCGSRVSTPFASTSSQFHFDSSNSSNTPISPIPHRIYRHNFAPVATEVVPEEEQYLFEEEEEQYLYEEDNTNHSVSSFSASFK